MRSKRILVLGGLGFVGSNLARKCLEVGAEVTIYDCLDPHSGGNLYNIEDIKDKLNLCLYDILNFDLLSQCIRDKDCVFNCAASTSHPFSMREPWMDMDANVKGTINILEALRRFNRNCRLIHIGTSTQIGSLKYRPADEKHPEFPTDIYSANKSVSEKYVLIYARAYGLKATVIRFANVYGPRACICSPEFTFNNFFVGLALQNKQITIFGDGGQMRNVMYIDDAIAALLAVAERDDTTGETFFAVGNEHYSVAEIAKRTVAVIGGTFAFVKWPQERKSIEIGDAIFSSEKLKLATGWQSTCNLDDGLRKTKEYYSGILDRYL